MQNLFTFEFVNDQLLNWGAVHSASELHGLVCGMVSGGAAPTETGWHDVAIQFLDLGHMEPGEDQLALLSLLLTKSINQMDDDLYQFMPLLPEDEVPLVRRTEELAAWCSGYLHGLGKVMGGEGDKKLSAEVSDAMRDIASITQVVAEDEDNLDENEAYWNELVEYIKVAVLTIRSEIKPTVH